MAENYESLSGALNEARFQATELSKQLKAILEERAEMTQDLEYLNKMCLTLMSLLPESVTPDDIRAAMAKHGEAIRE